MLGRDIALDQLSPSLDQLQSEKTTAIDSEKYIMQLNDLIFRLPPAFGATLSLVSNSSSIHFKSSSVARRAVRYVF